jgi:hypothetical protein
MNRVGDSQEQPAKREREGEQFYVGLVAGWIVYVLLWFSSASSVFHTPPGHGMLKLPFIACVGLFLLGQGLSIPLTPLYRAAKRHFKRSREERDRWDKIRDDDPFRFR